MSARAGSTLYVHLLKQIQGLVEEISANQEAVIGKKGSPEQLASIHKRLHEIQEVISFVKEFNRKIFESAGVREEDLKRALLNRQKGSELDDFIKASEKIKLDTYVYGAKMLKAATKELGANPAFAPGEKKNARTSKGIKPKGGFKTMTERQKWKKM